MRCLLALFVALSLSAAPAPKKPKVKFTTSMGAFTVELNPEAAPKTVENFLTYVREGHYKGTVFHRVIPTFMIQGGGFTENLKEKSAHNSIANESKQSLAKGLKNKRGTIAMARTMWPDSARCQFFINVKDNFMLDPKGDNAGYCVFGRVIQGMTVVDAIKKVKTANRNGMEAVPLKPVTILDAKEL
jgi:peptidyl-prolyl cis-trans isomerase A (cyclophilin A)